MHVLLIDDEAMVRKIVRKMLERQGHVVAEAENGRIGLAKLREYSFDLVVTDVVMPEIEGLEVLTKVRQDQPSLPVVVMSGTGHALALRSLEIASKLGTTAVLQKPFASDALAQAIYRSSGHQMVA